MFGKKMRHPTLRVSLALAFSLLVIVTSGILGTITYLNASDFLRSSIRQRLRDAVSVSVMLMNVEQHKRLRTSSDESSADYAEVKRTLQLIRSRCEGVRYVYTMRKQADGTITYVVDGEEDPSLVSHLGDPYDGEPSPQMAAAFEPPYVAQVDDRFYSDQYGDWLSSYAPMVDAQGRLDGILGMDMSAASVKQYERASLMTIPAISVAISLLAVGLGIWLSRRVSKPLLLLADDMAKVRGFDLTPVAEPHSRIKEVVEMHDALENMKGGLRSFRRYVPADLVSNLIRLGREAQLGTEKSEITTFFSDIKQFTTICENLPPEVLASNLAIYFRGMTAAILENRGTVDKFIGDAVMAFWGVPEALPHHPLYACRAALAAQAFLAEQQKSWAAAGLPLFETGIGIHTGVAMVGNVGFDERFDFTAIGDSVNVASRLESANRYYGTTILISESTYGQVSNRLSARWVDRIAVMGKESGLDVFELMGENDGITDLQRELVGLSGRAKDAYLGRNWDGAEAAWQAIRKLRPEDGVAQRLLARCSLYRTQPPPADWAGVFEMPAK